MKQQQGKSRQTNKVCKVKLERVVFMCASPHENSTNRYEGNSHDHLGLILGSEAFAFRPALHFQLPHMTLLSFFLPVLGCTVTNEALTRSLRSTWPRSPPVGSSVTASQACFSHQLPS